MQRKFTPNDYRIEGDVAFIILTDRHGDPVAEAMVDAEDLGTVLERRWSRVVNRNTSYAMSGAPRPHALLHRFILNPPDHMQVDHVNHNGLDCRKANLRLCTHAENMRNRRGAKRTSASGVRGVYWVDAKNRWRGEVIVNKKRYRTSYFSDIRDAAVAVEELRQKLHGEFAS